MTLLCFTGLFGLFGIAIPIAFRLLWRLLDYFKINNLDIHVAFENLMLMLWPTSIMTLPASDEPGFETRAFLFSLAANTILYVILGAIIWLGLRRHPGFLVLAGMAIAGTWWRLLTL